MIHERGSGEEADVDGARTNGGVDIDLAAIARTIGADWKALRHSLRRWATVELRRMQLSLADSFFAVVLWACALLSVLAVSITASVYLVVGLRSFFARWSGGGAPELLAAALGLGLSFGVALLLRAKVRRNIVRTTARRLAVLAATNNAAPSSPRAAVRPTGEPG